MEVKYEKGMTVLRVENKKVKAGENLVYFLPYCKYMNINPTISKFFVDGLIYTAPPSLGLNHPTGCGNDRIEMEVAKGLPAGTIKVKIVFRYQVNPIRSIDVTADTEQFTIVK